MLHFTFSPLSPVLLWYLQQLNFYSFRKIKYSDTLRIDPDLEKETANYWRFKHESFQRGKPQLLGAIKRMQGASKEGPAAGGTGMLSVHPQIVKSNNKINGDTAAEVQTLKLRIEEMTKNIDELTALVKEVSLKQEEQDDHTGASVGYKRKKLTVEPPASAAWSEAYPYVQDEVRPDEMVSAMDLDDMIALPVASMPSIPESVSPVRETSSSTQVSDLEFVDTLFTAFKEEQEGDDDVLFLDSDVEAQPQRLPNNMVPRASTDNNRPDAELMRRLSDALMLLPKETQEMIVNRLIAAITSTDFVADVGSTGSKSCATSRNGTNVALENVVVEVPHTEEEEKAPYPLAAVTLTALLKHYTSKLQRGESLAASSKSVSVAKSIPVIPVHA